jgi:hypothetical protein
MIACIPALIWFGIAIAAFTALFYDLASSLASLPYSYFITIEDSLLVNLISEGAGIVITVFIIDRLIKWRTERRWKGARNRFKSQVSTHINSVIEAYGDWLALVNTERRRSRSKKSSGHEYVEKIYSHRGASKYDHIKKYLLNELGDPIGKKLTDFGNSCDKYQIDSVEPSLVEYLQNTDIMLPPDSSWEKLLKDLKQPFEEIGTLVEKFQILTDEVLIEAALGTSDLDELKNFKEQTASSNGQQRVAYRTELIDKALLILFSSIRVKYYLRNGKFPKKSSFNSLISSVYLAEDEDILVTLGLFAAFPLVIVVDFINYISFRMTENKKISNAMINP